MQAFSFSRTPLEPADYGETLGVPAAGGYTAFEGWVRDHNEGRRVRRLEYEAFEPLAAKEGSRIVEEAIARFGVLRAACVHRIGDLGIGELAVWVGVSAAHRDEAFAACRFIIDEVKHHVPIWKKEHYEDGDSGWVNCERCAEAHHHPVPDYSRQVALPEVGVAGQARLGGASVLVIGAGGLGTPALQYLAAAGVGRIGIVDGDVVEPSNLHRQPLYVPADAGKPKALAARSRLESMNGDVRVDAVVEHASAANVDALVSRYDLVLECTDNLRTKFLLNDAVVRAGKPAVFGSVHQYEGQIQTYLPQPDWPCLRCVWPEAPRDGAVGTCAEAGVLGPVPGAIGVMQAMQALQIILGIGAPLRGLVAIDLATLTTRALRAPRRADCDHGHRTGLDALAHDPLEVEFASLEEARAAGFELVDVREAWERRLDPPEHLIELHLPMSALLEGRAVFPDRGRHLIVCAHGVRSLALAEMLREHGRTGVYSMRGGIACLRA
jgi:adenylyltransferase/sulfurtransferase